MKNKTLLIEIIVYAVLPIVIWKYGREVVDDYIAMLASTIPGIIYTIYRFAKDKQFNITGLFILTTLVIGTIVDILSGSAEQMLWNGVYLSLFYSAFHFLLFLLKRPLSLYLAVDFVYLQGEARKDSRALFFQKGIFKYFQVIQILFVVRGICMGALTAFLLKQYGIDGYTSMLIYKQVVVWIFSIAIMGLFFYIKVPVKKYFAKTNKELEQTSAAI